MKCSSDKAVSYVVIDTGLSRSFLIVGRDELPARIDIGMLPMAIAAPRYPLVGGIYSTEPGEDRRADSMMVPPQQPQVTAQQPGHAYSPLVASFHSGPYRAILGCCVASILG